jgi:outer membrane protein insertion porin family/translocation and assembly module TamA
MVDAVKFSGNKVIPSGDLAPIIATERTGLLRRWFGWNVGPLTCLDSAMLRDDALRIRDLYKQRGYPGTVVTSRVTRHGTLRAQVYFSIVESVPIVVDSVAVIGVPAEAADAGSIAIRLRGVPLDDSVVTKMLDSVQRLIRDAGYARAKPPIKGVRVDSSAHRATVALEFRPGRVTYVGVIDLRVTPIAARPALSEGAVRSLLRFRPGDRYSARTLGASQRDLYDLGLYRTVRIDLAPGADSLASDTVRVDAQLTEGPMRRLRGSGGWGTIDCFRSAGRFVDQNVLASGNRLELDARLSKIGLAHPFTGLDGLCAPRVRDDPFSRRLNYYAGATLSLRGVLGSRFNPSFTLYSERRSEFLAYEQAVDLGALASVSSEVSPQLVRTWQYRFEDGKTIADRAIACRTFGFCREQDLTSFLVQSPIHSASVSLVKNPLRPTDDPVSGSRWQGEARYGFTEIDRTKALNFARLTGELAAYRPLGDHLVVAARLQAGFVLAPSDRSFLLPPPERFYSGGQNSVRGYNQNLLGPGSYVVDGYDTLTAAGGGRVGVARSSAGNRTAPSGGNAMWVANLELRTRRGWPGDLLRWVAFLDAGRVWNTSDVLSVTSAGARVTPGAGVRLLTPIGPFRVDIGYNPYTPDAGPAFFAEKGDILAGRPGRVICVSPGSTEPLSGTVSSTFICPATYTPDQKGGLLPRLTFHFSIGSAF